MKKIKLRAWDRNKKMMLSWEEVNNLPIADLGREDLVWLESTGLFDKNGKEIYEMDFIKVFHKGAKAEGLVLYDEKTLMFVFRLLWNSPLYDLEQVEIVGSVYETHPEYVDDEGNFK